MRSEILAVRMEAQEGGEQLISSLRTWETSTNIKLSETWEEPTAPPQGLLVPVSLGPISAVSCAMGHMLECYRNCAFHMKSFSQYILGCFLSNQCVLMAQNETSSV